MVSTTVQDLSYVTVTLSTIFAFIFIVLYILIIQSAKNVIEIPEKCQFVPIVVWFIVYVAVNLVVHSLQGGIIMNPNMVYAHVLNILMLLLAYASQDRCLAGNGNTDRRRTG